MYTLDATAAREAENFSSFLSETGKYKGKFIRAEKLVSSNKGTHGVGFTFEADNKQTTRFDIWTKNAQGEPLMGFKTLNAIMACMRLRGLSVGTGPVERYDYTTKQRNTVQAEIFPDLLGKPIGLVLVNTEYEKMRDGQRLAKQAGAWSWSRHLRRLQSSRHLKSWTKPRSPRSWQHHGNASRSPFEEQACTAPTV